MYWQKLTIFRGVPNPTLCRTFVAEACVCQPRFCIYPMYHVENVRLRLLWSGVHQICAIATIFCDSGDLATGDCAMCTNHVAIAYL